MVRVAPVESREELRLFHDVRGLLDRKANPFWKHGDYKLFAGGGGRIAAIFDSQRMTPDRTGYVAFFSSPPSKPVAIALLNAARWWLAERGVRIVRGPVEPALFGSAGVDVAEPEGNLFAAGGWRKAYDLYRYSADVNALTAATPARADRVRVRPLDRRRFDLDADSLWWLYHSTWRRRREFSAVSRDEFFAWTSGWQQSMIPELTLIAEAGAEPAGFAVTIAGSPPRVAAFGIREGFRPSGAAMALAAAWLAEARRMGIAECDLGWIGEEQTAARRWLESLGARRTAVRRVFECDAVLG